MNKEEIEHELARARVAETTIKNNIIELLEQLIEAEKPKLRHGDFGVDERNVSLLIVHQQNTSHPVTAFDNKAVPCGCVENGKHLSREITKFGNIFDLLKEWSEDLEDWESENGKEGESIKMSIIDCLDDKIWFGTCGNSDYYNLEIAEEIWRKLGQMIATLKRKQS